MTKKKLTYEDSTHQIWQSGTVAVLTEDKFE
jgi:hypothetical protein